MLPSSKPLIAVPADCPFFDGYVWHGAPEQYLKAASDVADVTPVIVPSLGNESNLTSILGVVDGVLITGAKSNVEPSRYGKDVLEEYGPYDPARDYSSLFLIRAAIEKGLPLLTICRGIQELNVALGGTLSPAIQNIPGRADHRAPETNDSDEKFAIHQPVHIRSHTCLAAILGEGDIMVNSVHQQGIETLAPRLVSEAIALDGTIEGVSVKDARTFAIGVQWHPEYWAKSDEASRKIFEAFGKAVHQHREARIKKG